MLFGKRKSAAATADVAPLALAIHAELLAQWFPNVAGGPGVRACYGEDDLYLRLDRELHREPYEPPQYPGDEYLFAYTTRDGYLQWSAQLTPRQQTVFTQARALERAAGGAEVLAADPEARERAMSALRSLDLCLAAVEADEAAAAVVSRLQERIRSIEVAQAAPAVQTDVAVPDELARLGVDEFYNGGYPLGESSMFDPEDSRVGTTFFLLGEVPAGMTFNAFNGSLSGTPTAEPDAGFAVVRVAHREPPRGHDGVAVPVEIAYMGSDGTMRCERTDDWLHAGEFTVDLEGVLRRYFPRLSPADRRVSRIQVGVTDHKDLLPELRAAAQEGQQELAGRSDEFAAHRQDLQAAEEAVAAVRDDLVAAFERRERMKADAARQAAARAVLAEADAVRDIRR